jgi:glucosamine kinase
MYLIADSGTTKTEWCIISDQGTTETIYTSGINPFYQDSRNIAAILDKEFTVLKKFSAIYFYGAGCINQEKQNVVKTAILEVFNTGNIFIGSDLLAAAHSLCQDKPGVACILGTGSNSCYYNGSEIEENVSPLGFILGDEGSGAALGKKLIGDILKKQLPQFLINEFFEIYPASAAEILENVYRKPFPSRYLAGYAKFLSKNIKHAEIENIVLSSFREFVIRNLLQYPGINNKPIHFTGSIAFHFEAQLRKVIKEKNLIFGSIERAPMSGLIKYHINKAI